MSKISRRIWEDEVSLRSFLTSALLFNSGKLRMGRYLRNTGSLGRVPTWWGPILTVPSPNVLAADVFGTGIVHRHPVPWNKHQPYILCPLLLDPFLTFSHESFNLPQPRYLLQRSMAGSHRQSGRLRGHKYPLRIPEKKPGTLHPAGETLHSLRYPVTLLHQRITLDLQTKCGNR